MLLGPKESRLIDSSGIPSLQRREKFGTSINKSTRKKSREKINFFLGKTPPFRSKPVFEI